MKSVITFLLLTLLAYPAGCEPVEDAWNAYLIGDFDKVEKIVSAALKVIDLPDSDRAMLYFTIGCSDAMQGREISANSAFEKALDLDPALRKKSVDLPPPVWELFYPIQERIVLEKASEMGVSDPIVSDEVFREPDTVKVYIPIIRERKTILKSFSYPGWGHLSEGRKSGLVYCSVEALSVIGLFWSGIKTVEERDDYMKETDVKRVQSEYDEYNLYYNLTWGFGLAAAVTYIAAQIDFFSEIPPTSLSIGNNPTGSKMLTLSIRL